MLVSPHLRMQKALPEWKKLGDQYVSQVVEGGLKLDWIEEFDPENPSAEFAPPGNTLGQSNPLQWLK